MGTITYVLDSRSGRNTGQVVNRLSLSSQMWDIGDGYKSSQSVNMLTENAK